MTVLAHALIVAGAVAVIAGRPWRVWRRCGHRECWVHYLALGTKYGGGVLAGYYLTGNWQHPAAFLIANLTIPACVFYFVDRRLRQRAPVTDKWWEPGR